MEILSTNYNCRRKNPFVAGFLPILDLKTEDTDQHKSVRKKSADNNVHILITTANVSQSKNFKIDTLDSASVTTRNQSLTTIYQIDVSRICAPRIIVPNQIKDSSSKSRINLPNYVSANGQPKSKKALRNKRQKEAKRKRKNQRHVHFPEEEEMIAIVCLVEDDEFFKDCRNKYWEFFAIDRNRFEHRIQKLSGELERVLMPSHREKIYKERFANEISDEEKKDDHFVIHLNNCDSSEEIDLKLKEKRKSKKLMNHKNICESDLENETEKENESEIVKNRSDGNEVSKETNLNNESVTLRITLSETTFHFFKSI